MENELDVAQHNCRLADHQIIKIDKQQAHGVIAAKACSKERLQSVRSCIVPK